MQIGVYNILTNNEENFMEKVQREIERKAFKEGGGDYTAPAQLLGDFLKDEPTKKFGFVNPSCPTGVAPSDLRRILPKKVTDTIAGAINDFDKKLNGFNLYDAVLTAPESRSSLSITNLSASPIEEAATGADRTA